MRMLRLVLQKISFNIVSFLAHSKAQAKLAALSALDRQRLGVEQEIADELSLSLVSALKVRLRKVPYWTRGHLLFASLALKTRDLAGAYAAAQAVKALEPQNPDAEQVLARCYLQSQDPDRALKILESLWARYPSRYDFAENLVACYVALGEKKKAKDLIEKIPEKKRSGELEAARTWASN